MSAVWVQLAGKGSQDWVLGLGIGRVEFWLRTWLVYIRVVWEEGRVPALSLPSGSQFGVRVNGSRKWI